MKKIKDFFYKIKVDLKSIKKYPDFDQLSAFNVDYDEYWKKRRGENYKSSLSDWQKERADFAVKFLKPGEVVVDIGGGDGEVLKYIKSLVDIRAICVDFEEIVLEEARKNGLETINIDLSKMDQLDNIPHCDYIFGFEILEHMANPEAFILRIKNKVRQGMIFSFPNTGYYIHRLRLLFGKVPLQWVNHPGEHLRFWTVSDTRWWVKGLGFKIIDFHVYQGLPGLKKIWPRLFGQGIIIKISK